MIWYFQLWLIDWTCQKLFLKFHTGDFLLNYAPWLGITVEVDSDQIKTLIENKCYTMWKIADILQISKLSTENHLHQLSYVHCFYVWVPHKFSKKKKKTFLTVFLSVIFYLNIKKKYVFKANCHGQWKVDAVKYCGMEEIMGQLKWTTNNHTKGLTSSKEGDVLYVVGLEGSPLLRAPSGKPND